MEVENTSTAADFVLDKSTGSTFTRGTFFDDMSTHNDTKDS